jgi:hypothetical protein
VSVAAVDAIKVVPLSSGGFVTVNHPGTSLAPRGPITGQHLPWLDEVKKRLYWLSIYVSASQNHHFLGNWLLRFWSEPMNTAFSRRGVCSLLTSKLNSVTSQEASVDM